jgi:hypothetical protein
MELFHEFVSFVTRNDTGIPIVHQDSTSVISSILQGGGVTRAKHMRARVHLRNEALMKY